MDAINKSFIYILPVVLKSTLIELGYSFNAIYTYFSDNLFDTLTNTYCFFNKEKLFVIKLNYSELSLKVLEDFKKVSIFEKSIITDTEIIICLKIDDNAKICYEMFIVGKYSLIPSDCKVSIMSFANSLYKGAANGANSVLAINYCLKKSPVYREWLMKKLDVFISEESELGTIINIKDETYEDNCKKLVQ